MQLDIDEDMKAVLEFMQGAVPTSKLVLIAEGMPEVARLLWGHYPQEPRQLVILQVAKMDPVHQSQSSANELAPAK